MGDNVVAPHAQGQRLARAVVGGDQQFAEAAAVTVSACLGGDDQAAEVPSRRVFLPALGEAPETAVGIGEGEAAAVVRAESLFKLGGAQRVGHARAGPAVTGVGVGNPGGESPVVEGLRRAQEQCTGGR